jgi:hypothetical protein
VVIGRSARTLRNGKKALATMELVVAIGILFAAMLPMAFSFVQEQRMARAYYYRAVAMEIIDGEMEVLAAGEWRSFPPGRQPYHVRGQAATNLPPGQFLLTVEPPRVQLEWQPGKPRQGGPVSRQAAVSQVDKSP